MNIFKTITFFLLFTLVTGAALIDTGPQYVSIPIQIEVNSASYSGGYWYLDHEVTEEDLNCMALNIYHEARGEDIQGQYAVAEVVMNRVTHAKYPNTICGVIKDGVYHTWNPKLVMKNRCAWSWWCDRKSDKVNDYDAYNQAYRIAKEVIFDTGYNPILPYALFYHADYVKPKWSKTKTVVKKIGRHVFYV